jgi:hypothetical protein
MGALPLVAARDDQAENAPNAWLLPHSAVDPRNKPRRYSRPKPANPIASNIHEEGSGTTVAVKVVTPVMPPALLMTKSPLDVGKATPTKLCATHYRSDGGLQVIG